MADRPRRLAEGTLVEGRVVARLLGVKVLTLETTIELSPAPRTGKTVAARPPRTLPRRTPVPRAPVNGAARSAPRKGR